MLYTDGVTEAMGAKHEQFGDGRLIDVVEKLGKDSPETIRDGIYAAIDKWAPDSDDDVSVVVLRYVGE